MAQKKRVYCKNTVAGDRHRGKWDEETKTAAICALLTTNNICEVARRYGVPESTLRTWKTEAQKGGEEQRKSLFARERERAIRNIMHNACMSAGATVNLMGARLDRAAEDERITREVVAQLDSGQSEQDKAALLLRLELHTPMSDKAIADYARTLLGITEKAGELLGEEKQEEITIRVKPDILEALNG